MKCLYKLSLSELNELVENELNLKNWFIRDDKITTRKDAIQYSERFSRIRKQADKAGISYNDIEVVTWFDTLNTLYYTFDRIKDKELLENIIILQEYCIPFSSKRADYLFLYDNKILIVEFSFNKLNYDFNYERKLQQAIGYKELLSNILPKETDIGTYTFLVEPEEDDEGRALYIEGTEFYPNHYKIDNFANYIEKFFKKNIRLAYKSIMQIEED